MDEREVFFAAITAHPDEDTPRLAFADWLDEHDEVRRARFIREQVRGAAHRGRGIAVPVHARGTRTGFADLLSREPWVWDDLLGTDAAPTGYIQVLDRRSAVLWRRGFVEAVLCSGARLPRALAALRPHPIREILLMSAPSRTAFRSIDPDAAYDVMPNVDNDPCLVTLLQRSLPAPTRVAFPDRRPRRTECFFRVVG